MITSRNIEPGDTSGSIVVIRWWKWMNFHINTGCSPKSSDSEKQSVIRGGRYFSPFSNSKIRIIQNGNLDDIFIFVEVIVPPSLASLEFSFDKYCTSSRSHLTIYLSFLLLPYTAQDFIISTFWFSTVESPSHLYHPAVVRIKLPNKSAQTQWLLLLLLIVTIAFLFRCVSSLPTLQEASSPTHPSLISTTFPKSSHVVCMHIPKTDIYWKVIITWYLE